MRQLKFNFVNDYKKQFGGSLLLGKRKTARPLSTRHPIHLVLKSCQKKVFNPSNRSLENLIKSHAEKFDIQVYDLALNWSHIHLLIKLQHRTDYVKFIRSLTSVLSLRIRAAQKNIGKIFTLRPFTRIVSWGRDFKRALSYQLLNQLEAFGIVNRREKKRQPPISVNRREKKKEPPISVNPGIGCESQEFDVSRKNRKNEVIIGRLVSQWCKRWW